MAKGHRRQGAEGGAAGPGIMELAEHFLPLRGRRLRHVSLHPRSTMAADDRAGAT